MRKILIFGGTGAMGEHLVELLIKQGDNVYVTTRRNIKSKENLKYLKGNAHDLEFINSLLKTKWDVLIDFMVYTTTSFKSRIPLFLKATDQYIFISSGRVFSESTEPLKESSKRLLETSSDEYFLNTDEYSLAKGRQEDILTGQSLKNWTIVRPYITYSNNRIQLGVLEKEDWLYRAINDRTILIPKEILRKKTTLTYGYDVSKCIKCLAGNKRALGQTYNLTTKVSKFWDEILLLYSQVIEDKLGIKIKVLLQENNGFLSWKNDSEYQLKYDRLFDREFNNNKIVDICNNLNFSDIEDSLKKSLDFFLEKPNFKLINFAKEAQKDKLTKECASLSEFSNKRDFFKYLIYRYLDFKILKKWKKNILGK